MAKPMTKTLLSQGQVQRQWSYYIQ